MTKSEVKPAIATVKELMSQDPDALREIVRSVMQAMLEAEMDETVGAGKSERSDTRLGYRSGYYTRTLVTRVGKLELRVPQDRERERTLPVVGHHHRATRGELTAPSVIRALVAAPCSVFPLRLARELLSRPGAVSGCVSVSDLNDRMVGEASERVARAEGTAPTRSGHKAPPICRIVERDRAARFLKDQ